MSTQLKHLVNIQADKKDKHLLIKFSHFEYNSIKKKADLYTAGNVSEWVRYASKQEPREEDLVVNE